MKALNNFDRVFLHRLPVDMRKGINGLCEVVASANMGSLTGCNLFLFCGRRRDVVKILYFDSSGFALWQKRLEEEKFYWPKKLSEDVVELSVEELQWLLNGFEFWKLKPFSEVFFEKVS